MDDPTVMSRLMKGDRGLFLDHNKRQTRKTGSKFKRSSETDDTTTNDNHTRRKGLIHGIEETRTIERR